MNALLKLLTPVRPGMPWDDVLTAARVNAIQTLLLHLARGDNVSRGNNILLRRFEDGYSITARAAVSSPSGTGEHPYVLGSTNYGSSTDGPSGADGPWGGSGDLSGIGDGSTPYTDTWHRDRLPLTPADVQTDCVDIPDGPRLYALSPAEGLWVFHATEGSGDHGYFATRYQSFRRTRRYDRHGLLSITAESYGEIVTDSTMQAT